MFMTTSFGSGFLRRKKNRNNKMQAKEYFKKYFNHFYSWIIGDILSKSTEFQDLLKSNVLSLEEH